MRILFTLTPAFNPNDGGVQRTTYKLGKYFSEQGLQVAYYSFETTGHIPSEYGELFHSKQERGAENSKNIDDLEKLLLKWSPDVVVNQMPYEKKLRNCLNKNKEKINYILIGCLRNSLFSFKENVKDKMKQMLSPLAFRILNNLFGVELIKQYHWIKHRKDLKQIIDKHDRFLLLAPPNKDELQYFVGRYKPDKVIVMPNSIPKAFDNQLNKEKIILHVGRLNITQKRSDLLLDFWRQTYKHLPDWQFIIVGDGPYRKILQKDLENLALPNVQYLGYQKPEEYYQKAAIFMMPSAYEGFPNTILEAQSYGCVPLAFNSYAALDWIVNNSEDAILCKPYDTKEMAQMTIKVASDDLFMKNLQQKAIDNAKRFTIQKVGKKWISLFHELNSKDAMKKEN